MICGKYISLVQTLERFSLFLMEHKITESFVYLKQKHEQKNNWEQTSSGYLSDMKIYKSHLLNSL